MDLVVVDAFTDAAFAGNPAAVAVLSAFPPDEWMQLVAREMNLSETAFVVARPDGDHDLRWFTPSAEVDLCGHATLATAHVLGGRVRFHTRSGPLDCRSGDGRVEMSFPSDPPVVAEVAVHLPGAAAREVRRGRTDILVAVDDAGWLRGHRPDIAAIADLDARALIVTAPGDRPGIDFVSRVFAPAVGVPEDPVTGSAHCTLAPYWSERTGRTQLTAYQASARGGTVRMSLEGDRVILSGNAVTVSEIRMLVDLPG
ncbi:MAG: PhzF family phenazine biosynthesis protein [Actinomycetota bacterium]|nr:PhzF family phenazine biosynthesis protein [Actinomycetota bacterium]